MSPPKSITEVEFKVRYLPRPIVIGIDPGPEQSALVRVDDGRIVEHCKGDNEWVLGRLATADPTRTFLVLEQIASFGMPVGAEVFETVFWSGRFVQAWQGEWDRVKRHQVKTYLCGNQRAKDANIRQALLDRFGPGKEKAIGTKARQGPLYGLKGDEWSALAVAVTWLG